MKYEYLKGGFGNFDGRGEEVMTLYRMIGSLEVMESPLPSDTVDAFSPYMSVVIASRRPITDDSDLNEYIGQQSHEEFIDDFVTFGKYDRQCKGVVIDVYDVLQAFEVVNPALQHLIKKALCAGLRGHKKREQDLVEILESAKRAIELEGK